ncbi:hypothetical protein EV286_107541 [Rhizobium sp. BK251]|nr:hypothetical protein EV286_107541 [Rhizobium sp. BK251]
MTRFLLLMLPLCALISSCQTVKNTASVCDGWQKLTPRPATAATIIQTDRPFANQIASHNRFGASQACWN